MPLVRLLALIVALTMLTSSPVGAAQDDATQEAAGGDVTAMGDPRVGTEVQYLDEDGDEIAVATVVAITDPFDDFSEFFTPEEDARYIAVEFDVRSTGDEVEVQTYNFGLQTADGFFYNSAYVARPEGREEPAELENIEVEEGEQTSGILFFAVPEDAMLARLLWQPESGRLLLLADLREDRGD